MLQKKPASRDNGGIVFCTAPAEQVRAAVRSQEGANLAWRYLGQATSPFARDPNIEFVSWGTGHFTFATALKLWSPLRAWKPAHVLLPWNNADGTGYGLLRFFLKTAVSAPVHEVPRNGRPTALTWTRVLASLRWEPALYRLLMRLGDLCTPLFHLWLKPNIPAARCAPRPPLEPETLQDFYREQPPVASVVIRTWNEEKFLARTLDAVLTQKEVDAEVIVIDSGSTDRTLEIARDFPVRVYRIPKPAFHYAAVLNLGARLARGRYVVNLSAHAIPASPWWLNRLVAPLEQNTTLCGVFGRELPMPGWASPFEHKLLTDMFPDRPVIRRNDFFFSNANAAMPRALLLETPFDEAVDWGEDQEWVHRMQERGFATFYQPESPVYHSHNLNARACFTRTLRFQRMLFHRMHRDCAPATRAHFRAQLPGRAAALRRFMIERRLVPSWKAFFTAPWCEYINYLGCDFAFREWKAERVRHPAETGPHPERMVSSAEPPEPAFVPERTFEESKA